jgi:hypothetical protein
MYEYRQPVWRLDSTAYTIITRQYRIYTAKISCYIVQGCGMETEEINTEDKKKALKTTKNTKETELVNIKCGGDEVIQFLVNIFLY